MKKRLLIISGAIVLAIALISIAAALYFNKGMIESKTSNVSVSELEKFYSVQNVAEIIESDYGLTKAEEKDIYKNPLKYKNIFITCDTTSTLRSTLYGIKVTGKYDKELSKIIVGKKIAIITFDKPNYRITNDGKTMQIIIRLIVKPGEKTESDLKSYIENSEFTLSGSNGIFSKSWKIS